MSKMRLFVVITLAFAALAAPIATAASAATSIQNITPSQGPITGGTQVTLTGTGFTGTTLTMDGTAITPTSASDTQLVFQTPVRENGIASVQLSGNGPTAYAEFLYLPPSLQSLPPGYITTVMGIGLFRGDGRPATNAMLEANEPGFALAADGSLYFSEHNQHTIRRVRADGIMERYAGTMFGYAGDGGPALKAQLQCPRGLAIDPSGNLLVADACNNCIRRIDAATGIITTLYGGPTAGFSGDGGPVVNAQFNWPLQIAFDGLGNLYVLEFGNVRIRKIDTRGTITTIAGTGVSGFSGDGGPATQATFNLGSGDWGGLAADSQGNVYLADTSNGRVRRIDAATGIITTFVANAGQARVVFTDRDDNLYVGINIINSTSARILKLSPTGQLLQSWGKGYGFSEDGTAMANAPMCQIHRLVLDLSGNILYADECSSRIRRINVTTGLLDTLAGMGPYIIGETGPALATILANDGPDLLFLPDGNLLLADPMNYRIRKLDRQGNVSTVAGDGFMSIGGNDGVPALKASIYPAGIARMPNGDILVDNIAGISRIDSAGIIHAVNNLHNYGFSGDGGPAISAITNEPWDVASDAAGNIFIADANNNRIRRIDAQTGIIDTVAGSGPVNGFENYGKGSYCGDGGPATQACINTPWGIAVAPDGTLYIAENDQRVRKVTPDGIITTFFSIAGKRLRLSSTGNLFMGSYRIQPNGHAFTAIFATPTQSAIGDGIVARSQQSGYRGAIPSSGVAVDSEGNLFVADSWNKRIRAVRFGAVMAEPGSTVAVSSGNSQTTAIRTAFPMVVQVTLKSPEGTLENGIRVDFTAPASGASCTFPGGSSTYSTLTNIAGQASATCTANSQLGSYSVTATPLALGQSVSFSLTNALQGCTYNISPSSYAFNALSNTGTVTITPSASSCTWTATSNDSWITITSSASGTGNSTVNYSITASSDTARIGTITIGGQTHTVNQARWIYSNSIGTRNSIKITDMSGTLSASGAAIPVAAWDVAGNSIPESPTAPALTLSSNGTTTISGTDLRNRFPTGTPMTYALSADSSKYIITNVKISADGTLNVPNGYTSETTKFVANSVGQRNSIKITDMSGSLSTPAAISVNAWDVSGTSIPEATTAIPLTLVNHGTTTITGNELIARFPGTPMSYEFTVGSSKYVITNVKSSTDNSINIPYAFLSGTTNFVANSIGTRNTIKISDVSGSLSASASITVSAWDVNGNAIFESPSIAPLQLVSRGTTTITGDDLALRFPTVTLPPMSYEFTVGSAKYIITNVKRSSDRTINIPAVYYSGTTTYASNDISSRSTIKITDASGTLTSPAAITVNARDVSGNPIAESTSAIPLTLVSNGTTTITGTELIARFPTGTPVLYEFTIGSTQYLATNVTSNTDVTVTIPNVYSYGVAGGI